MKTLIFATGNAHKAYEVKKMLAGLPVRVLTLKDAGLDLDIEETGKKAGMLQIVMERPRKNQTKLLLLMDSGGSMWSYTDLCSRIFNAVHQSNHFKDLQIYYFHNCVYDEVYKTPECLKKDSVPTQWLLDNLKPEYKVIYVENSEYEAGTVTDASEKEGSEIPEGSIVTLTVSGSKGIEVPDVLGYQRDEAIEILETAGLYVSVKEVASAEVETGLVIGQDPAAGTRISTGSTVELTVSSGPDLSGKVQMVDLRGMSEEAAEELLIAMGLKVGTIGFEVTDDEEEVGIVLDQTVEEGTYVDAGTEIGLTVGKQMTYSYNVNISQPSYDYEEGTMVHIVVSTDSGQVLLTTDTDSFPYVEGRITEIPEGAGSVTLTWSYTYTEEEEATIPVEGEDSGEGGTEPASESSGTTTTIVVNEVTEEREETRDLEFQKEY